MPPKYYITFIKGSTEITFGIYCALKDLKQLGLEKLQETVIDPSDYIIKIIFRHPDLKQQD